MGGGPVGVTRVEASHCLKESGGGGGNGGGGGTPGGRFIALLVLVLTEDSALRSEPLDVLGDASELL